MADESYSVTRGVSMLPAKVTVGSLAPNAGDVEVRINLADGITKQEVRLALDNIWRFLESSVLNPTSGINP